MRMLVDGVFGPNLTYDDVFLFPRSSAVESRSVVDLSSEDGTGTTIPIVLSNMTAVAGRRMAETVARRGGLAVIPQDIPVDVVAGVVSWVKSRHVVYDTAVVLAPTDTVSEALALLPKRAHGALVVVDDGRPVGIVTEADCTNVDRFTQLRAVMSTDLLTLPADVSPQAAFDRLVVSNHRLAPVVTDTGQLLGILTRKGALRATLYRPAVDGQGRLRIGCAVGISGDVVGRADKLLSAGADVLVIDTAHGHQDRMLAAVRAVRALRPTVPVVAGNVATADGVADLVAAGASNVMIGSWFAGTYESPGDIQRDADGLLYKDNFGMASARAVRSRTAADTPYERARKALFEEGMSTARMYLDPERPGAEDILDLIVAGVRSACAYTGARNLAELYERATVGVQTSAGYVEGMPLHGRQP
jgi:IMP dehydrogenase